MRRLTTIACTIASMLVVAPSASAVAPRGCAWLPGWDTERALATIDSHGDQFEDASPFWYGITARGRLHRLEGSHDGRVSAALEAHGINELPTITNHFRRERAHAVLRSAATRRRTAAAIVSLVVRRGYDGIDIDFENVSPRDRGRMTAFVRQLGTRLHARGLLLSVTVQARTATVAYEGARAADYAAIGTIADRVRVMAYDFHWSGGRPGPVAPLPWVRDVTAYVSSNVPPAKVQLGVPLYGYDWSRRGGRARAVTWSAARRLVRRHGATVSWRTSPGESTFRYRARNGSRHIVWFADRRSVEQRMLVADAAGLRGICTWRLGGEDTGAWDLMRELWT